MLLFKKHGLKIIGVFLLVLVILFNLPQGKAFFKTLIILPEFIPNSPIKTINLLTYNPQILEVSYPSQEETIYADLWLPQGKEEYPGAVLHLGVDIDRKNERIQKLANAFARSGIATLVPNIPSLSRRRVLEEGKIDLISSFEYLKTHPQVIGDKVGFIGFCVSGGLVLLSSEDPKIADKVAFVAAINPYFDLDSLYENITLRQIKDDGGMQAWKPNFKTVEIFNRETINLLESEKERQILNSNLTLIEPKLLEEGKFPPLDDKTLKSLSSQAQFTYELLTNTDQKKVAFYKKNTTQAQKNFLRDLSPKTNIGNLKAKTFILMDKKNVYIPYTQAEMLDHSLEGKNHLFVETKILPEGNIIKSLPLKDYFGEGAKIFSFVYQILLEIT